MGLHSGVESGPVDESRRAFVARVILASIASATSEPLWNRPAAAILANTPVAAGKSAATLRLRPSDYPPLSPTFGSIRIGLTPAHLPAPIPPLLIVRDGDTFRALSAQCTHAGCLVPVFRASKVAVCECHGSRFAADGSVIFGPADTPLPSYPVEIVADGSLEVQLTGFPSFSIELRPLTANGRLPVTFATARHVAYQVMSRTSPDAPWTPVPFALDESSFPEEQRVTGSGDRITVYMPMTPQSAWISVAAMPVLV